MYTPLKPPRGIFVSTRVLYHPDLTPAVRDTLIQLMGLSWYDQKQHTTPPLTLDLLVQLTGKKTRTLRGHLAELRKRAALRWQYPETKQFIILFSGWLFNDDLPEGQLGALNQATAGIQPGSGQMTPPGRDARGRFLPGYDDEEEGLLIRQDEFHPPHPIDSFNDSLPTVQKSAPAGSRKTVQRSREKTAQEAQSTPSNEPPPRILSKSILKKLVEIGVFRSLLGEVAKSQYTEKELRALIAWCQTDAPDRPAPLFIGRLRNGALVPAVFFKPPCSQCGMYGGHKPECGARYLTYLQDGR